MPFKMASFKLTFCEMVSVGVCMFGWVHAMMGGPGATPLGPCVDQHFSLIYKETFGVPNFDFDLALPIRSKVT